MSPQLMTPRDAYPPHDTTTSTRIPTIDQRQAPDITKWIALLLTFIGMLVAMVVWATNEHSEIREWTVERDYENKTELREVTKESYVPLHEFTKLKQKLEDQSKKIDEMSLKLDKMLDEMHQMNRGRKR